MNEEDRLRKKLLRAGAKVIDIYIKEALGERQNPEHSAKHQAVIMDIITPIVQAAPPRQPLGVLDLHEGDVQKKVDRILKSVSEGKLNVRQGQELMKLIQSGQDIIDMKAMLELLEQAGK